MHYKHDIEKSELFALASFQDMKKNAVPYDPVNFSVWYNYHAEANPELVGRIKEISAHQERITDEQLASLFDEFVSGEILTKSRRITEKLESIAREIAENLDKTGKSSDDYVGQMESLQEDLSTAGSINVADGIINKILAASRSATAEIHALRENARSHQSQMDALRDELEAIRDESRTDQLTGIANRRQFDERLRQLCESPAESHEPLCLVLGDIDHFKKFNDHLGHQAGDIVLAAVGEILRNNVKGKDLAARYGGEEFALLLPGTSLADAISYANSLRNIVSNTTLAIGDNQQTVTMSFGVAQYEISETMTAFIARADKNLYRSKDGGRNRVTPGIDEAAGDDHEMIDVRNFKAGTFKKVS